MTQRPESLPDRPPAPAAEPDALSHVLRAVRLTGAVFFISEVSSPCPPACVPEGTVLAPSLSPRTQNIISYHVVTRGRLWAGLYGDGRLVPLDAGDILVIPRGDSYFLGLDREVPPPPDTAMVLGFMTRLASGQMPFLIPNGGGRAPNGQVVCGFLGCDDRPFNPLLASLPPLFVMRGTARRTRADRLDRLIELTLAESEQPEPGGASVRLRLSELIFVETIRRHLATIGARDKGWLAGLRDETVGRALALLHEQPARTWTLPTLAKEAGASRSALADRFTRLVGQPPMAYLTQWRMQLAARLLTDGARKVSAVASEVGYDSEAAFSRAFKRAAGHAPAAWRGARSPTPDKKKAWNQPKPAPRPGERLRIVTASRAASRAPST
jgi:AraC-like DNA-binding protein